MGSVCFSSWSVHNFYFYPILNLETNSSTSKFMITIVDFGS